MQATLTKLFVKLHQHWSCCVVAPAAIAAAFLRTFLDAASTPTRVPTATRPQVTELPALLLLPTFLLRRKMLRPMAAHAGGTILAAGLALQVCYLDAIGAAIHAERPLHWQPRRAQSWQTKTWAGAAGARIVLTEAVGSSIEYAAFQLESHPPYCTSTSHSQFTVLNPLALDLNPTFLVACTYSAPQHRYLAVSLHYKQ